MQTRDFLREFKIYKKLKVINGVTLEIGYTGWYAKLRNGERKNLLEEKGQVPVHKGKHED